MGKYRPAFRTVFRNIFTLEPDFYSTFEHPQTTLSLKSHLIVILMSKIVWRCLATQLQCNGTVWDPQLNAGGMVRQCTCYQHLFAAQYRPSWSRWRIRRVDVPTLQSPPQDLPQLPLPADMFCITQGAEKHLAAPRFFYVISYLAPSLFPPGQNWISHFRLTSFHLSLPLLSRRQRCRFFLWIPVDWLVSR